MNRSQTAILAVIAATALACGSKSKPGSDAVKPAPLPDTSALWNLAPDGAMLAIVAADATVDQLRAGLRWVKTDFVAAGGQPVIDRMLGPQGMRAIAASEGETAGLDLTQGMALFLTADDKLILYVPVVDRAAFRRSMKATVENDVDRVLGMSCRMMGKRYACVKSLEDFALLAPGAGRARPKAQGHVEIVLSGELARLALTRGGLENGSQLSVAIELEPGAMTLRVAVDATPDPRWRASGISPLAGEIRASNPSGVFLYRGAALLAAQRPQLEQAGGNPLMLEALKSLTGEVAGYLQGNPLRGMMSSEITSEAPWKALMAGCSSVSAPGITAKRVGDRCQITLALPGGEPLVLSAWVDDTRLRIGIGDTTSPGSGPIRADLSERLDESWVVSIWGHGLWFVDAMRHIPWALVDNQLGAETSRLLLWAAMHLTEVGFSAGATDTGFDVVLRVRTTYAYPEAVHRELEPILRSLSKRDASALERLEALVAKHPDSALARDHESGAGSLMAMAIIGAPAVVAVSAFRGYIKKSKTTEARQFVKKIYDGARASYMDGPAGGITPTPPSLPTPSSDVTPPLGSCCGQPDDRCEPSAASWSKAPWVELQFSIDDPHYYSYQYVVADDGKSFTVRAHGDLDCDGVYSTFEMMGEVGPDGLPGAANLYREQDLE